jgi:hypothetical protein
MQQEPLTLTLTVPGHVCVRACMCVSHVPGHVCGACLRVRVRACVRMCVWGGVRARERIRAVARRRGREFTVTLQSGRKKTLMNVQ